MIRKDRIGIMLIVLLPLLLAANTHSCCITEHGKEWGKVVDALYRSDGNSVLVLHPTQGSSVTQTIELSDTQYPANGDTDKAFLNSKRLAEILHVENSSAIDLKGFQLRCGTRPSNDNTSVQPLTTHVVMWSDDWWDGEKREFSCGGGQPPAGYDIDETLGTFGPKVRSVCVVHEGSPAKRIKRCRYGPQCDDGMLNGTESDVDCGSQCLSKCAINKSCNGNNDCQSGLCSNGKCKDPCSDGVKNLSESDVDCGGSCTKCANSKNCNSGWDCTSGNCESGKCDRVHFCSGASSCTGLNQAACNSRDGCHWGAMTGSSLFSCRLNQAGTKLQGCGAYKTKSECEAQGGCNWF